jgi:hypothetical protein
LERVSRAGAPRAAAALSGEGERERAPWAAPAPRRRMPAAAAGMARSPAMLWPPGTLAAWRAHENSSRVAAGAGGGAPRAAVELRRQFTSGGALTGDPLKGEAGSAAAAAASSAAIAAIACSTEGGSEA